MTPRQSIADRAASPLALVDPQDGLFDQEIDDPDLVAALEAREQKRQTAARAKGQYEDAADTVKGKLDGLNLGDDTIVRIGRFRVKISPPGESSHVEYDTVPRKNTTITLLD